MANERTWQIERKNMEYDLTEIIINIKNKDKISISYIQRTFSYGFNKSNKIFHDLIEGGYIDAEGKVNKKRVDPNYVEGPKVIFLDVDGVLNCRGTEDVFCGSVGIEDEKVALLKQIVNSTKAVIVLVSSWKEWWYKEPHLKREQDSFANYLDRKLAKQGLTIVDKTEDYNPFNRGEGIIEFIDRKRRSGIEISNFIILDDELFDYKRTKLTKNLIQTSYEKGGLQKKHVRKAIEKLC